MANPTGNPPNGRGCGTRESGGGYLCTGLSEHGLPIEAFIIDPVRVWPGEWIRGMKVIPRDPEDPESINDVLVFVGRGFYASPWTFVEEVRRYGASRRFAPTLPFDKLVAGRSRTVFVHRRAYPMFRYKPDPAADYEEFCKLADIEGQGPVDGYHKDRSPCAYALRDLAFYVEKKCRVLPLEDMSQPEEFEVQTPSFTWKGLRPIVPATHNKQPTLDDWSTGLFLALPITHVEFCQEENVDVADKARSAGYEVLTLDY